jgi:hypothetical protein
MERSYVCFFAPRSSASPVTKTTKRIYIKFGTLIYTKNCRANLISVGINVLKSLYFK